MNKTATDRGANKRRQLRRKFAISDERGSMKTLRFDVTVSVRQKGNEGGDEK